VRVGARAQNGAVEISVADQGRATPADLDAQLIGRVDDIVERTSALAIGSSVGLPMARQIIEMHGGRMWFETGTATVWHVTVPIAARPAQPGDDDVIDQQAGVAVAGSVRFSDV
jgi:signal transduction histidine kinase